LYSKLEEMSGRKIDFSNGESFSLPENVMFFPESPETGRMRNYMNYSPYESKNKKKSNKKPCKC
jgi:hypothetical protein